MPRLRSWVDASRARLFPRSTWKNNVLCGLGVLAERRLPAPVRGYLDLQREPEVLAEAAFHELARHRVQQVAIHNLEQERGRSAFEDLLLTRLRDASARYAQKTLARTLGIVGSRAEAAGGIWIKGVAVEACYPHPFARTSHDVDLVVPGFEQLWRFLADVEDLYQFQRIKVYQYPAGRYGGSVELVPRSPELHLKRVDVSVGGFHLWGASAFRADLWLRSRVVDGHRVPSWEDTLLIMAGHVATQWHYRLRDLNDLWALLHGVGPQLDWDYVIRMARSEGLLALIGILLRECERVYGKPLPGVPQELRVGARLVDRAFATYNFGETNVVVGALEQTRFLVPRYSRDFGPLRGTYEALRNGAHLVRFRRRAFYAGPERRRRKIGPNEVLVLVRTAPPDPSVPWDSLGGRSLGSPALRVVDEATPEERFLTPYGTFAQASYQGEVLSETAAPQRAGSTRESSRSAITPK